MKCKNHPRYQVKRHPRGRCVKCWIMWRLRRVIRVELPKPSKKRAPKLAPPEVTE